MNQINESSDDVEVKRWLSEHRKALRLFVQLDETQSHWIPFDLYIIRWNSDIGII